MHSAHLEILEDALALGGLLLLPHRRPHVGVDHIRSLHSLIRRTSTRQLQLDGL